MHHKGIVFAYNSLHGVRKYNLRFSVKVKLSRLGQVKQWDMPNPNADICFFRPRHLTLIANQCGGPSFEIFNNQNEGNLESSQKHTRQLIHVNYDCSKWSSSVVQF